MAASSSTFHPIIIILLLVNLTLAIAVNNNNIVFDDGYTVKTILDGNKFKVYPNAVIATYGSSSDLIILDSANSGLYTVSFFDSQVSEVKKLSGNGNAGYMDGDLLSAMFNNPKSFALDKKNNIYIADKKNYVIRKISKSGVTTIAGGNVQKPGKADGPAQNATFSPDFELAFDPQRCALLISDHGNQLIRQLDLKPDDCSGSSSGSVLGSTAAWGIGMVVACLVGLIIGFAIRPYVLPHEASGPYQLNVTWKRYLINLGKQAVTFYFVMRNAVASHNKLYQVFKKIFILTFTQLSLVFGLNIISPPPPPTPVKSVSLLDCDEVLPTPLKSVSFLDYDHLVNNETTETHDLVDELKDLITFNGTVNPNLSLAQETAYKAEEKNEVFPETCGKIDKQIYANFAGFVEGSKKTSSIESWEISY